MTLLSEIEALEIMSEQRAGVHTCFLLCEVLGSMQPYSQGSLCYSEGIRGREHDEGIAHVRQYSLLIKIHYGQGCRWL